MAGPLRHAAPAARRGVSGADALLQMSRRILTVIGLAELAIAMLSFWIILLLVMAQVLARQLSYSLWWAQEWTELLIMYAYFLGTSFIYQARQMIIMEFLIASWRLRWRIWLYVFTQFLVIVFCVVVVVAAVGIAHQELDFPSFVIGVPRFYWTLPLIVGSISMGLTSAYFAVAALVAARDLPPDAPLSEIEERYALVPPDRRFATVG
ncbi:MAG: TRAP transporter small permease subunit [Alphaproteobacteria bacterium]|nr:TRAP transporter small permease subunit [Alphaproteobacteria bacterium]